MRTDSVNRRVFIPPYWLFLLLSLAAVLIGVMNSQRDFDSSRFHRHARALIVLGTILFVYSSTHYSLHPSGIWVHLLGIPIRRIRWSQISTAEYIQTWSSGFAYSDNKGYAIAITLPECPAFAPEIDEPSKFSMKHPISFIFIRFSARNRKKIVEAFRHYYPELDIQLGCDTSWLKED